MSVAQAVECYMAYFHANNYKYSNKLLPHINQYFYGHPLLACFFFFFFFSSPNLSGRRLDVYHTSTHGVALVQI